MHKYLITAAALLLPVAAHAKEPTWEEVRHWELAYQALNIVDTAQTLDFLDRGVAHEANPLIGRNPKPLKLIAIKALGGAAHYLLVREVYRHDPKTAKWVAIASVALQGGVVAANLRFTF